MRLNQIWKLYLGYTLVLVVCMVTAGLTLQCLLASTLTDHLRDEVRTLLRVIGRAVPSGSEPASLDPFCRTYQALAGVRVTVIRKDGGILGESDKAGEDLDNHADRPEVLEALERGEGSAIRHSRTLGKDMLYVAQRLPGGNRVLRLAMPMEKVEKVEGDVMLLLSLLLYLTPLAAMGLSFLLARRLAGKRR